MSGETQPVAWRVKDSSGGWMICSETAAKLLIERNSALIEPLYSAAALASRDAEIERLRGELRRAHLKRLVELSEEFGGYDELSTSALSALKTAREGNNA